MNYPAHIANCYHLILMRIARHWSVARLLVSISISSSWWWGMGMLWIFLIKRDRGKGRKIRIIDWRRDSNKSTVKSFRTWNQPIANKYLHYTKKSTTSPSKSKPYKHKNPTSSKPPPTTPTLPTYPTPKPSIYPNTSNLYKA